MGVWSAAAPFVITGTLAIVAGGLVAAAVAHRPVQPMVWMSAYLVLIVGVAQFAFGTGQAWLTREASLVTLLIAAQWLVFNLGNAGVIVGTLTRSYPLVVAGTILFAVGIALFLVGTRHAHAGSGLYAYRTVLGLIFLSSLVGLALSARTHGAG
ncbi:MAG TPA: hypothetical protein VF265_01735 [Nevskiaceae bacterium]